LYVGKCLIGALSIAMVLALAACGSSGGKTGSAATTTSNPFENATWEKAGPTPSISAKMVCSAEARAEIAASLGVKAQRVTKPVWDPESHLYSCDYVYPRGKIRLTVKEMSSGAGTTAYFNQVKDKYGTVQELQGLGQGAWVLRNGDVVVRKDYKTMLIDVTGIPANMIPAMRPSDVAINIAALIMSCWTGA
jgi:hypothetical protein